MSASSTYLDKNSCYNSQVYAAHNYGTPPHCYYSNMDYLSSGVTHSPLNVPVILSSRLDLLLKPEKSNNLLYILISIWVLRTPMKALFWECFRAEYTYHFH